MVEIPDNPDELALLMLADMVSHGFVARQYSNRGAHSFISAWMPSPAMPAVLVALEIEDGEAKLTALLDILEEHVDERVTRAFIAWFKTPKMSMGQ